MDSAASPLVLTKFRMPTPRSRLVPRVRLIERLIPDTGTDLVLVVAPAGYGKSTLLAEWSKSLQQKGVAVAWYAIDASDDTPILFGSYLVAGLAQALGLTVELEHIAQLLRSSPESDLQRILPAVINAVASSDRDCVLILDDYHLIGAPAIHNAIAFLLDHLPGNMTIAIGSRSDPSLPLARLRARGKLHEIRAADLRFTEDETAQFLNAVMQLELSPELVAVLEERTEGWIAGLQLAALSLSGRSDKAGFIASFSGDNRYLVEYLMEEVVNRQPEEVRSFLLSTSILERMCAPLCDAILGETSHGEAILDRLDRANLFVVALDDQGYWYRYHRLFRDFLQTRLRKTQPESVAMLHRAASEWYATHGYLREAVQHAFQTQDWTYAAALVEQNSMTMIVHSEISTIHEWCSEFPEEVMGKHPMLCLLQGLALACSFRRENRDRIEARLEQAEHFITLMEDRQLAHEHTDLAAVVRTFSAMAPDPAADPRKQLALAQVMLGYYPEGDLRQFSGLLGSGYADLALHEVPAATKVLEKARQIALQGCLYFGVVESTFHLARLTHSQGQLRRAAEICRQGQADIAAILSHPEQELPALGCLDIALGSILMEQDRLEEAELHLCHGMDLMGWGMNPYYLMAAFVALARLREIQGRSAESAQYLTHLEEAWPDIAFYTHGLRIMQALRAAPEDPVALAKSASWCRNFSPPLGDEVLLPGMGPFGGAEAYYLAYLAWAGAQIAIGHAHMVLPYLEKQLDLASIHGLTNRVIELSLVEALAWRAQSEDQRAWAALGRALVAAQPEGYIRIFDQGAALNRLLAEAANHSTFSRDSRDYIQRILAVINLPETRGAGPGATAAPDSAAARSSQVPHLESGEHITGRELGVLRLMGQGASNQEIAEQLVITVGTVKSHINHILVKLDAHNRTEAVVRAREIGLLEI